MFKKKRGRRAYFSLFSRFFIEFLIKISVLFYRLHYKRTFAVYRKSCVYLELHFSKKVCIDKSLKNLVSNILNGSDYYNMLWSHNWQKSYPIEIKLLEMNEWRYCRTVNINIGLGQIGPYSRFNSNVYRDTMPRCFFLFQTVDILSDDISVSSDFTQCRSINVI